MKPEMLKLNLKKSDENQPTDENNEGDKPSNDEGEVIQEATDIISGLKDKPEVCRELYRQLEEKYEAEDNKEEEGKEGDGEKPLTKSKSPMMFDMEEAPED